MDHTTEEPGPSSGPAQNTRSRGAGQPQPQPVNSEHPRQPPPLRTRTVVDPPVPSQPNTVNTTVEHIPLKLNAFPSDLDRDKVYDWARATKVLMRYMNGTPELHFPALLNALLPCPRARTFALDQLDSKPSISLLEMVDTLQQYFGHRDPAAAAAKSLQDLAQEVGEDFHSYFHRATTIFERLPDITNGEKLRQLVAGLHNTYIQHLQSNELLLRQLNPGYTRDYQQTVDFLNNLDALLPSTKIKVVELNHAKKDPPSSKVRVKPRNQVSDVDKKDGGQRNTQVKQAGAPVHTAARYNLSEEEFQRRKDAGHCYYCDKPWVSGHRCLTKGTPNAKGAQQQN